jgi:hypothetical protein
MGNQSAYLLLRVIPLVPNLLTPTQTLLGGAVGLVGIASFFAVDLDWIGLDWIGKERKQTDDTAQKPTQKSNNQKRQGKFLFCLNASFSEHF